jgi:hypothetical protein
MNLLGPRSYSGRYNLNVNNGVKKRHLTCDMCIYISSSSSFMPNGMKTLITCIKKHEIFPLSLSPRLLFYLKFISCFLHKLILVLFEGEDELGKHIETTVEQDPITKK